MSNLGPNMCFGYGIDSGTGSFMDLRAARALVKLAEAEEEEEIHEAIREATHAAQDSAALDSVRVAKTESNVVAFVSGHGDGFGSSWWGLDSKNQVTSLVTDFFVLPREREPEAPWHVFDLGPGEADLEILRVAGACVSNYYRGGGLFQEHLGSYPEAVAALSARLEELRRSHGAEVLVPYDAIEDYLAGSTPSASPNGKS